MGFGFQIGAYAQDGQTGQTGKQILFGMKIGLASPFTDSMPIDLPHFALERDALSLSTGPPGVPTSLEVGDN